MPLEFEVIPKRGTRSSCLSIWLSLAVFQIACFFPFFCLYLSSCFSPFLVHFPLCLSRFPRFFFPLYHYHLSLFEIEKIVRRKIWSLNKLERIYSNSQKRGIYGNLPNFPWWAREIGEIWRTMRTIFCSHKFGQWFKLL